MEKGSTRMEENIEGLGAEDIFILHEDHRPTSLIDTWEFCKDYKEAGNFQTGVLVSPKCSALSAEALVTMTVSRQLESCYESMHVCRRHSYSVVKHSLWVPPLQFRS